MDPQMVFPVLARNLQERLRLGDAGVVDQHVDSAELAHRTRDELLDLVVVTHVGTAVENAAPELFDLIGRGLGRFLVDLGEADIGARARKAKRYFLADSASRSAYHYDFILKLHSWPPCTCLPPVSPKFHTKPPQPHEVP